MRVGEVHGVGFERGAAGIRYDTDNRESSAFHLYFGADGIPVRPDRPGQAFGNDHGVQVSIALFERAAAHDFFAECFKIPGAHPSEIQKGRLLVGPVGPCEFFDP